MEESTNPLGRIDHISENEKVAEDCKRALGNLLMTAICKAVSKKPRFLKARNPISGTCQSVFFKLA